MLESKSFWLAVSAAIFAAMIALAGYTLAGEAVKKIKSAQCSGAGVLVGLCR